MTSKIAHNLNDNNKWRSQDIRISCEGNGSEESEVTFDSLNLNANVLLGLKKCGFMRPSPIQLQAIPLGRCGLDLILQSKSGTGKTCVFVVIALEMIESFESNSTQVLILSPTREIAVQICEVVNALSSERPNICCSAIGGTKVKEDVNKLKSCQIVVGTPGRVRQLIELHLLKTNSIRLLVWDECDKLLDQNFKLQMDVIYESLPQNKQMLVCSATMTEELSLFLSRYMRSPTFVRLNADNPALIGLQQYYRITDYHHLNHMNFDNKIEPLIEILKKIPFSQCLVFSNYQTRARMLCDKLNANNWPTAYISAEKCQTERLKALSKLKKYKCRILVSTDLTARGIDVENINLVINMDVPFDAQTYLHRIGRAGRFGSRGIAITIASNGRELESLQKIIKGSKLEIEELSQPIPENIWNSVPSIESFSSNQTDVCPQNQLNKCENTEQTEEYNPWNQFSLQTELSSEFANKWISYNDIEKDFNENKSFSNIKLRDEPSFSQSKDKNMCSILPETKTNSIAKVFSDKCCINAKDLDLNCDESRFDSEESAADSGLSNTNYTYERSGSTKPDLQCFSQSKYYYKRSNNPSLNRDNENAFKNKYLDMNSSSANLIQSGFNQWATALFPPISSISNPLQYNDWINKNKSLWFYMMNPFQTFQLTQNANCHSFNN